MSESVLHWPIVITVSIEVFSSFTTNIKKEARSFSCPSVAGTAMSLWGEGEAIEL